MAVTAPRTHFDRYYGLSEWPTSTSDELWAKVCEYIETNGSIGSGSGHQSWYFSGGACQVGFRSKTTRHMRTSEDGTLSVFTAASFMGPLPVDPLYNREIIMRWTGQTSGYWMQMRMHCVYNDTGHQGGDVDIFLEDSDSQSIPLTFQDGVDQDEQLYVRLAVYGSGDPEVYFKNVTTNRDFSLWGANGSFAQDEEFVFEFYANQTSGTSTTFYIYYFDIDVIVSGPVWVEMVAEAEPFTFSCDGTQADVPRGPGTFIFPDASKGEDFTDHLIFFHDTGLTNGGATSNPAVGADYWVGRGKIYQIGSSLDARYSLEGLKLEWYGNWHCNITTTNSPNYEDFWRLQNDLGEYIDFGNIYDSDQTDYVWGYRTHNGDKGFVQLSAGDVLSTDFFWEINEDYTLTLDIDVGSIVLTVPDVRQWLNPSRQVFIRIVPGYYEYFYIKTRPPELDYCFSLWAYEALQVGEARMECQFNVDADLSRYWNDNLCYLRRKLDSSTPGDPDAITTMNPHRPSDENYPLRVDDTIILLDRYHREFYFKIRTGASGVTEDIPNIVFFKEHETELYAELIGSSYLDDFTPIAEQHTIPSLISGTPAYLTLANPMGVLARGTSWPVVQAVVDGKVKTDEIRIFQETAQYIRVETTNVTGFTNVKINFYYVRGSA